LHRYPGGFCDVGQGPALPESVPPQHIAESGPQQRPGSLVRHGRRLTTSAAVLEAISHPA
jgi:hypothetical protein